MTMQPVVQPGEALLGKYRVERVLGQGGMGVVVAVRHIQLGELFAMKMLLAEALAHQDAVERFLREARASAKLKSEHVARVHDVGSLENGAPYMVMEHLQGADLKQILRQRGPLPVDEAVLYVYQACEAVTEAHANGIVHRDLKPANLFLTRRSNGTPCIKVLDFGISKELEPAVGAVSDLTRTGVFMGSPLYMSPEQMANVKATDKRSDIWALGAILYELLTGRQPFTATSMPELIAKVLTVPPPPPRQLRPDVHPHLEQIALRCLEKQPEYRFQSVQELAAELFRHTQLGMHSSVPAGALSVSALHSQVPAIQSTMVMNQEPVSRPRPMVGAIQGQPPLSALPTASPAISSLTGGAWGNTSKTTERKSKGPLIFAGAGIALVALLLIVVVSRSSPAAPEATSDTKTAARPAELSGPTLPPTVSIPAVSAGQSPLVAPAEPLATAVEPTATAVKASAPQPKSTQPSKPTSTVTKKKSVPGFND